MSNGKYTQRAASTLRKHDDGAAPSKLKGVKVVQRDTADWDMLTYDSEKVDKDITATFKKYLSLVASSGNPVNIPINNNNDFQAALRDVRAFMRGWGLIIGPLSPNIPQVVKALNHEMLVAMMAGEYSIDFVPTQPAYPHRAVIPEWNKPPLRLHIGLVSGGQTALKIGLIDVDARQYGSQSLGDNKEQLLRFVRGIAEVL